MPWFFRNFIFLFVLAAAWNLTLPQILHAQMDRYLRFGLGAGWSLDTAFFDLDCASTTPAALFGCGAGPDGLPRGGYGDFGGFPVGEVSVGFRSAERIRVELGLSIANDLTFLGQSNFSSIPVGQAPIFAQASSTAFMVNGFYELRDLGQDVRLVPYLTLGAGISYNRIADMTYSFPSLGATSATIVPGGSSTELAAMAGFGVDLRISESLALDIGYRFWDRGDMATEAGNIRIIRDGASDVFVPIDSTKADLTGQHVYIGMRVSF